MKLRTAKKKLRRLEKALRKEYVRARGRHNKRFKLSLYQSFELIINGKPYTSLDQINYER